MAEAKGFAAHPGGWRLLRPAYAIRVSAQVRSCERTALEATSWGSGGVPSSLLALRSVGVFQQGSTPPTRLPVANADFNAIRVPGFVLVFQQGSLLSTGARLLPTTEA